ncbi:terpene synthase family protein [Candidatus Margulisiibacteriota bacterium]
MSIKKLLPSKIDSESVKGSSKLKKKETPLQRKIRRHVESTDVKLPKIEDINRVLFPVENTKVKYKKFEVDISNFIKDIKVKHLNAITGKITLEYPEYIFKFDDKKEFLKKFKDTVLKVAKKASDIGLMDTFKKLLIRKKKKINEKELNNELMQKFSYYILLAMSWKGDILEKDLNNICLFLLWAFLLDDLTDINLGEGFIGNKPKQLKVLLDKFLKMFKGEKVSDNEFSNDMEKSLARAVRCAKQILDDHKNISREHFIEALASTLDSKIEEAKNKSFIPTRKEYLDIDKGGEIKGVGIASSGVIPVEEIIMVSEEMKISKKAREHEDYKFCKDLECYIIRILNDIWSFGKEFGTEGVVFNYIIVVLAEYVREDKKVKDVTLKMVNEYLEEKGEEELVRAFKKAAKDHNTCVKEFYKVYHKYESLCESDDFDLENMDSDRQLSLDEEIFKALKLKKRLIEKHAEWLSILPKILKKEIISRY